MKTRIIIIFIFLAFLTKDSFAQVLIFEGFDNGIPSDWTITSDAADGGWKTATAGGASSENVLFQDNNSGNIAFTNDDQCDCDKNMERLVTSSLDFSGLTTPEMNVQVAFENATIGGITESASIEVSIDNGNTWEILEDLNGTGLDYAWQNVTLDLKAYAGQSDVLISFHYSDNGGNIAAFAIDNLLIFEVLEWEIGLLSLDIADFHEGGEAVEVRGRVKNLGKNKITSFDLWWTDGEETYEETFTGLNIAPLSSYDFLAVDIFANSPEDEASVFTLEVIVSKPNGNADGDESNNTLSADTRGIAFIPEKSVVVEEATGTWCGWCPRGTVGLEYMSDKYQENFIGIAVHGGDPMMIPDYIDFMNVSGFPSSNIDRQVFGLNPDKQNLDLIYKERIKQITFASIADDLSFDADSRLLKIELSSEFVIPQQGDFRYAVVLIEDDVTGEGFGFNQANYYSSESAGIDLFSLDGTNWKNLPEVILAEDISYDHVARHLIGGYNGVENSLPAIIELNTVYNYSFEYVIPDSINVEKAHVVSLLLNATESEIVNAISSHVPAPVGIEEKALDLSIKIAPNPMLNLASIHFELVESSEVEFSVLDINGRVIYTRDFGMKSGKQFIEIDAGMMVDGIYIAQLVLNGKIANKKFTVVH